MELSERAQKIADSYGHEWMCERIVELEDKLDAQILATAFTQDDKAQLEERSARLLAVARAADAYLLAHEGWMSRGKWDRAMLLGEDLQTALAAVEDLL